jgi:hypothetical protein
LIAVLLSGLYLWISRRRTPIEDELDRLASLEMGRSMRKELPDEPGFFLSQGLRSGDGAHCDHHRRTALRTVWRWCEVSNGLLLRSDLHKLFDEGYITVDPADRKILVSPRIREEFENGREYYRLHGSPIREPAVAAYRPSVEHLEYHAYTKFR